MLPNELNILPPEEVVFQDFCTTSLLLLSSTHWASHTQGEVGLGLLSICLEFALCLSIFPWRPPHWYKNSPIVSERYVLELHPLALHAVGLEALWERRQARMSGSVLGSRLLGSASLAKSFFFCIHGRVETDQSLDPTSCLSDWAWASLSSVSTFHCEGNGWCQLVFGECIISGFNVIDGFWSVSLSWNFLTVFLNDLRKYSGWGLKMFIWRDSFVHCFCCFDERNLCHYLSSSNSPPSPNSH